MDSFDKLEGNDQAEMICLTCRKVVGPPCKSWRGGRELHNRVPRPSRPTTGDVFSDSDLNFDEWHSNQIGRVRKISAGKSHGPFPSPASPILLVSVRMSNHALSPPPSAFPVVSIILLFEA